MTTQEELLTKMKTTMGNLDALTKAQEETIKELKYFLDAESRKKPKRDDISKLTNVAIPHAAESKMEPCPSCKRSGPENSKEQFMAKQERLLKEIEKSKEELAQHLQELETLEGENENKVEGGHGNESVQQIFNIQNLGMLQELLEQAEESDEVLLFTDHKKNTWQIISRNDINVGDGTNIKVDPDVFDVNEEGDKAKAMIRSKNLVIDVEGIENEHQMAAAANSSPDIAVAVEGEASPEKEERVSVIEDVGPEKIDPPEGEIINKD